MMKIARDHLVTACLALSMSIGIGASPCLAKEALKEGKKTSKNKRTESSSTAAEEIPAGSLALYVAMSQLPEPDALYRRYFASLDDAIARQYHDNWRYHESQLPYAMTRSNWEQEHLSIGTLDFYGRAPYEADVRRSFAEGVLRQRLDAGMRAYFAAPERAAVRKAAATAKAMTEIRDVNVKLSKDGSGGQLKFGYNVLDDSSKLEYSHGHVFAGIYNTRFSNSLSRPEELISRMSLRVSTNLIPEIPTAYMAFAAAGTSIEFGCEKQLAEQVHGRFMTTQPRKDSRDPASYNVLISYWF